MSSSLVKHQILNILETNKHKFRRDLVNCLPSEVVVLPSYIMIEASSLEDFILQITDKFNNKYQLIRDFIMASETARQNRPSVVKTLLLSHPQIVIFLQYQSITRDIVKPDTSWSYWEFIKKVFFTGKSPMETGTQFSFQYIAIGDEELNKNDLEQLEIKALSQPYKSEKPKRVCYIHHL